MPSEIRQQNETAVVKPDEDIVASVVESLRQELQQAVQETSRVALDLEKVEMVDSMGLGLLIATHNSLSESGSALEVRNVNNDILNLFKTMRLDHHFRIV